MTASRREAIAALVALTGSGAWPSQAQGLSIGTVPSAQMPTPADGTRRLQIVMLAHPDMTALDLVAPQLIFATVGNVEVQVVWKDSAPVLTDSDLQIAPTTRFDQAARAPDLLFVPGGLKGTTAMLHDPEVLDFVRSVGDAARWVTSVCTGSLLLGAAGLLRGYRATSHWYVRDLLPLLDAEPVNERVVQERNRITGAGVTAGIDLALTISAALRGEAHARRQQLVFEYAPRPPFASGTPELAGTDLTTSVLQAHQAAIDAARLAVVQARPKQPNS